MLGTPYILVIRHQLFRALPHREGGGVPVDLATGDFDRALVRAQLRKELQCIRNVDTSALVELLAARPLLKAATGATSTLTSTNVKQFITLFGSRMAASPTPAQQKSSPAPPSLAALLQKEITERQQGTPQLSISHPSKTLPPSSSPSSTSSRPSRPISLIPDAPDSSSTDSRSPQPT
jgi:hypothetical protein